MTDEHIRRSDASSLQNQMEFFDDAFSGSRHRSQVAPTKARAVVTHHPVRLGKLSLQLGPTQNRRHEPGLQHNRGAFAVSNLMNMQAMRSQVDHSTRRWMQFLISARAKELVHHPGDGDEHQQGKDPREDGKQFLTPRKRSLPVRCSIQRFGYASSPQPRMPAPHTRRSNAPSDNCRLDTNWAAPATNRQSRLPSCRDQHYIEAALADNSTHAAPRAHPRFRGWTRFPSRRYGREHLRRLLRRRFAQSWSSGLCRPALAPERATNSRTYRSS